MACDVVLLLPGLRAHDFSRAKSSMASLGYFLRKATQQESAASVILTEQILWLCGYDFKTTAVAPLTAVADGLTEGKRWLRADPVTLQPDISRVYMGDSKELQLTLLESQQLANTINDHLPQHQLIVSEPSRWYIELSEPLQMQTTDPNLIINQDITDFLPCGKGSQAWLCYFTEIQMLLHTLPFNQQRQQLAQPTVDALWFWGSGDLPQPQIDFPFSLVMTNDPVAKGLALLNTIDHYNFASLTDAIKKIISNESGKCLLVDSFYYQDEPDFSSQRIDEQFFSIIMAGLQAKNLSSVTLYCGDGVRYSLSSKRIGRWWKRW